MSSLPTRLLPSRVKGGIVPAFHDFELRVLRLAPQSGREEVKILVRPIGWRRMFRFWPYHVGQRVRFKLELENKSQPSPLGNIAIYEDLPYIAGSEKERYPILSAPSAAMFGSIPPELNINGSIMATLGAARYTLGHPLAYDSRDIANICVRPDSAAIMWLLAITTPIAVGLVMFFVGKYLA